MMKLQLHLLLPGSDPRNIQNFTALAAELQKRYHPARPDINWAHAEQCCLSLFQHHGVDLQSASWFTLIAFKLQGLMGINDGLKLINRQLSQYDDTIWPKRRDERMAIFADMNHHLTTGLRRFTPLPAELPTLYHIDMLLAQLQQRIGSSTDAKQIKLDKLQHLVLSMIARLENKPLAAEPPKSTTQGVVEIRESEIEETTHEDIESQREREMPPVCDRATTFEKTSLGELAYETISPQSPVQHTVIPANQADVTNEDALASSRKLSLWRPLFFGILLGGLISVALFFSLREQRMEPAPSITALLPQIASFDADVEQRLHAQLNQQTGVTSPLSAQSIAQLEASLQGLTQLSPIWAQQYGLQLTDYLQGEQYDILADSASQWQAALQRNAASQDALTQWSLGMAQLTALSERLDTLDSQPRRYITGSELKTVIFNARQHFYQGVPLEEELRWLTEQQATRPLSDAEYQRIDNHFIQLLNRYAVIKHQAER